MVLHVRVDVPLALVNPSAQIAVKELRFAHAMHVAHVNLQVGLVRNGLATDLAPKVARVIEKARLEAKSLRAFAAVEVRLFVYFAMVHELLAIQED